MKLPNPGSEGGTAEGKTRSCSYCLLHRKHFVNRFNYLVTVENEILFDYMGFMCYSIHTVIFHGFWQVGKLHVDDFPWGSYSAPCTHSSFKCSVRRYLRSMVSCFHLWWPWSWDSWKREVAEHSAWWIFDLNLFCPFWWVIYNSLLPGPLGSKKCWTKGSVFSLCFARYK